MQQSANSSKNGMHVCMHAKYVSGGVTLCGIRERSSIEIFRDAKRLYGGSLCGIDLAVQVTNNALHHSPDQQRVKKIR